MTLPEIETLTWGFLVVVAGTTLRSFGLAVHCGVAEWVLRSRMAELKFTLWRWLLFALFALPVLLLITPRLERASRVLARAELVVLPPAPAGTVSEGPYMQRPLARHAEKENGHWQFWILLPFVVYLLVAALLLLRLAISLRGLAGLARRSSIIADREVRELAQQVWLESGARLEPRIAESRALCVPVTFEALAFDLDEPYILLPATWHQWDQAKLRAVLTHEMMHIQRRDSRTLLLASLATCLFWFNPLAWFLRRQLAVLAEEACDELTLSFFTPELYSAILIDFAKNVRRFGGRLFAGTSAVVQGSQLKRRIERLFVERSNRQKGRRLITACMVVLFAPAVYLAAAARLDEPGSQVPSEQDLYWGTYWNETPSTTAHQAAALESSLQTDPNDLELRTKLLFYYSWHRQSPQLVEQALWFVQHHPASLALAWAQSLGNATPMSEKEVAPLKSAWEHAIAANPVSADVLFNACEFFKKDDPERALTLLHRVQNLDPGDTERYASAITSIYVSAEMVLLRPRGKFADSIHLNRELALKLSTELEESDNPTFLSRAGTMLAQINFDNQPNQQQRALELIQRAIDLDPDNPAWKDSLESAKAEPIRRENYRRLERLPQ
jgi:beta-lactamase regulating signal transducer with metallopeptidase domain